MASPSPTPVTPPPPDPQPVNPTPLPTTTTADQPPPSSTPPQLQSPLNPNPNPNPNPNSTPPPQPQPQQQPIPINPFSAAPSFRPAPQFTPIPPPGINPGQPPQQLPGYPGQPPPQQQLGYPGQQQPGYPGQQPPPQQQQPGYPGQQQQPPPQQQPGYPGQQPPPSQQQQLQQPGYPGQPPQQQLQQPGYPGQPGQQQLVYPGQQQVMRPPYMPIPNGYMPPPGTMPPNGAVRYPYPPMNRPAFLPRPGPGGVPGLVSPFPRPTLIIRPPVTPAIIRPIIPIIIPVEKPQTTVYVGKIAPSVENDFIRSLLELCGPIKSWKRAQDPSDGTPKKFGFCEFESAEGVLRALRLLSKRSVDGEELVLNVNQATRDYLERYVTKKKEELKKQNEIVAEEAKKEGESATEVEKVEGDDKKESGKPAEEESNKDAEETENKEKDMTNFGLVTDEDRNTDQEASEKLANMIEERIKNKPLPPPPPRVPEPTANSNMEVPSKSGDKDSDIDTVKNDVKNDDETTSEPKSANRAGTVSPDRRRNENRGRDRERDRDRRDKERELDRLERERERERQRRERDREFEVQKAERFYKERLKEWETREKEREYKRKYEREKEKERERERRRLIEDQEDESDDDSRKRRRKSEIEEKRRRRRREREDDLADKLREEEEIAEAKKRAEEKQAEQQKLEEKQALEPPSVPVANGDEAAPMLVDAVPVETKDDMEEDQVPLVDPAIASHAGDVVLENGTTEEPMTTSDSAVDMKGSNNAPTKKLGFGIVQSGKRTTVPSVFHEEEDEDAQKDKKMRPLVPIDYSTEADTQAANTNDGGQPPASESGKRANPKEVKSDVEKERSRRSHDKSSHRDRDRDRDRDADDASRAPRILDAKQLIDMIPKTKDDLFSYDINWAVYDENRLHERMRPWISKKITEFLGEEETTLVEFIVDKLREHVKAEKMLDLLQQILDEEAEMFVLKMWRMLIFEVKRVETGLVARPGA